ncbi:hypothetical protein DPMN_009214 [Dreissena polymorpha]|uniref:DUF155 domain-containing protein n=1 Tax=Dreissena polymorpha TaxID=45954 RepID=A0A9D4N041_DREPO|nr:hypothetical protein DPMN_009214 [Dreissena polymorpha]
MSSTATNQDVAKKVPTKPLMKIKTKKKIRLVEDALQYNRVATYPVGQELNLESLAKEIVSQDTYKIVDMPTDLQGNLQDVIMTTAKYKFEGQIRDAFFFRDGTVSLWTMSESEMSRILIMNILNKRLLSSCMLGSKARPVNRANAVGSNFNILNGGTGFLTNSLNISALTCVVHSRCLSLHVNRKANQNTCTFLERKSGNVPIMQTLGRKSYIKYGPVLLWDQIMQTLGRKSYIKSGPVLLWDQIKVCYSVMSSTATNQDVAKKVPTKPLMKIKTKKKIRLVEDALQYNRVATYPVGQELNLESLAKEIVSQDTYKIVDMPTDLQGNLQDVIMTTAKYKFEGQIRDAFFFRDGTVSLWTMSESEKDDVLQLVRRHCIHPYNPVLTEQESEIIPVQNDMASKLVRGKIHIRSLPGDEKYEEITMMEKFAFSNAMAQSVTLAINENKLEKFIDQLESETQLLRDGQPSQLKRRDINMKLGEVFLHRQVLYNFDMHVL